MQLEAEGLAVQAAKYFSYIFFAVAVAVIAMFAMLVCYHMLVRRRAMHLRRRNIADFRVRCSCSGPCYASSGR